MKIILFLRIAGIISLVFTLFHLAFPFMPGWEQALNEMHSEMKNIFITFHYGIIALLAGVGFISTFQAKALLKSSIKTSILILFSSLYFIRIITEFTCWGFSFPSSVIYIVLCLIPIIFFGICAFKS